MNTKRMMRAFGVALLMLVVLISTSGVAHADRRSCKDDRKKHSRRDHKRRSNRNRSCRRQRSLSRLWLNYNRSLFNSSRNNYYYVPGRYETRIQEIMVEPGHYEIARIPAKEISYFDRRGRRQTIIVKAAQKEKVWVPARFENRRVQVWVPGYYTSLVTQRRPINTGLQFSFKF